MFGGRVVDAGRRLSSALILFRTNGKFWPLDRVIQILRPFQLSMTVIIASWQKPSRGTPEIVYRVTGYRVKSLIG